MFVFNKNSLAKKFIENLKISLITLLYSIKNYFKALFKAILLTSHHFTLYISTPYPNMYKDLYS